MFYDCVNAISLKSYVAIGDSLTEGLGDESVKTAQGHGGWADRLAALIAEDSNHKLKYANLALRGCSTKKIMTQGELALSLRPELVTIMPGANDLMFVERRIVEIENSLDSLISRLLAQGTQVILLNVVDPSHVALASVLRSRSKIMSQMINRVAARHSVKTIDLNSLTVFQNLGMWSDDLAHFSAEGHKLIANLVAESLGLKSRWNLKSVAELEHPLPNLTAKLNWLIAEAIPFLFRRMRGRTSGDDLSAKYDSLKRVRDFPELWPLEMQKVPLEKLQEEHLVSEMGLEPTPA